jgi:protein-L-isoaspartate(D-aspartate) O-methyltransferase
LPMQYSCAINRAMEQKHDMTSADFEAARASMVASQLRTNAVTDLRVLDAMGTVPREDYVPDALRAAAYADVTIPMGDGRAINPPMTTGRLLNEARINPGDSVLIVGSASGYVAAVVAAMGADVWIASAEAAVKGDVGGPYDVIIVDGAVEKVPGALVAALKTSGRLATGLAENGVPRLAIGRKGGSGFGLVAFADADIATLAAFARPSVFAF